MDERERHPALPPASGSGQPPVPVYAPPPWHGQEYVEYEPAEPTLSRYWWILKRHRWKILAFVACCVTGTYIISSRLQPLYEATATVDVDRTVPRGILGQEATPVVDWHTDQFMATQVKLIQSDSVLRPVVRRFRLDENPGAKRESLPEVNREDAPVRLPGLKVTRPPNTFIIQISYRCPNPRLAADVANAIANSYIEHTYSIRYRSMVGLSSFMEKQLEDLKAKMERSSAALAQFERELNVINPEEKTNILSARLLQLNTEYTNAQADRVAKEAAYNSVRSGSLEAALASSQGEALKKLSDRLDEAQEKFAVIKAQYGPNHPEYRRVATQVAQLERQVEETRRSILRRVEAEYRQAVNREEMLRKAVEQTKAELDRLNARWFEYQALKREADADKKLYEELLRKIKEAGINAGFQNSAVRLADPARPPLSPVFPNMQLNLALAFLLSSLIAVGVAILSDSLDKTVRDPEIVRLTTGAEVVGSLPVVKEWRKRPLLPAASPQGAQTSLVPVKELRAPAVPQAVAPFSEAIRTLRNSILLGSIGHPLKSVLITSAGPGEGKTTVSVHLAVAHAQQKDRTLLIEGDLRRPGVANFFGMDGNLKAGLSVLLTQGGNWRDQLVRVEGLPELDILPAGPASRAAADALGKALPAILREAANEYSLVIVDSPPVLGFPEPLQMAAAVDGVVLVTVAGETHRKALASAVGVLERLRANILGVVLNEVTPSLSDGYYGYYGYYGKYYKYYRRYETDEDA
jgi:succinoglycan biosynthesis transport protein ExoP